MGLDLLSPKVHPYPSPEVRSDVDIGAKVTTKGQITIPKEVRDALGITEGDHVVFRIEEHRAVVARTPDLLDLAGSVPVPAAKRGMAWNDVIAATRTARAGG